MAQALALSVLPLDRLQADAADQAQLCAELGVSICMDEQAALAQALLDWFKTSFFTWVRLCSSKPLRSSSARPSAGQQPRLRSLWQLRHPHARHVRPAEC